MLTYKGEIMKPGDLVQACIPTRSGHEYTVIGILVRPTDAIQDVCADGWIVDAESGKNDTREIWVAGFRIETV